MGSAETIQYPKTGGLHAMVELFIFDDKDKQVLVSRNQETSPFFWCLLAVFGATLVNPFGGRRRKQGSSKQVTEAGLRGRL